MVKEFKKGKYYRYTKGSERPFYFNNEGDMDFLLDCKPHLCVDIVDFRVVFKEHNYDWYLNNEDFEEVFVNKQLNLF